MRIIYRIDIEDHMLYFEICLINPIPICMLVVYKASFRRLYYNYWCLVLS